MKRVHKKSYLFLGIPVLILAIIAGLIVFLSFQQGTVTDNNRVLMIAIGVSAGVGGLAGLIAIILFFAKTYEVKE